MYFYSLNIKYDGNNFYGSAKQKDVRTVEEELTKSLKKILQKDLSLVFAGRTDKKVHAINQTVSFSLNEKIKYKKEEFLFILKKILPSDIEVFDFKKHQNFFNARFDCKKRSYEYLIQLKPHNLFLRNYVYQYDKQLNLSKFKKASKIFLGTHNFLSYSTSDKIDTVRTIFEFKIKKIESNLIKITISANGFLRSQIRMMISSLLRFCEDKLTLNDLNNYLLHPKKGSSHLKIAAEGLYFKKAIY